jgi:membrane protease YdiL (CAAX protease family)
VSDENQFQAHLGGEEAKPPGDQRPTRRTHWGYREIFLLVAIAILAQMLVTAGTLAIAERFAGLEAKDAASLLLREPRVAVPVQIAAWLAPLAFIAYVVTVQCRMPIRIGFAWNRPPLPSRSYVRMGALLALGSMLASIAIGELDQPSPMRDMFANRDALWILGLYGILVAPCIEEMVFRGFLFAPLERYHGQWVALLATSAVFSALHGAQYGWQWQRLVLLMAVGCAFGGVRIRSGSAKASAIVHAAYNALLFLAVLLILPG